MRYTPLQDRVLVKLDESIPNAAGIYIPPKVDEFRAKGGAIEGENRGTVVAVGPGKPHPRSGVVLPCGVKAGDVIRFSELKYETIKDGAETYVVISDADVLFVEEPGIA